MNSSWMMVGIAFWFLARWKIDAARWARRYRRLANEQRLPAGMPVLNKEKFTDGHLNIAEPNQEKRRKNEKAPK